MKAIIYTGIGLFLAASIFGAVDYYNTNKKGAIDKLYKAKVTVLQPEEEKNSTIELSKVETKTEATVATASSTVKKNIAKKYRKFKKPVPEIKFSDFSRGRILSKKIVEGEKTIEAVKIENK